MPTSPKILAFAGSARRESLNRKLLAVAVQATRDAGGEVTLVDLNEFELPLYHGDLEDAQGIPANARRLMDLMLKHEGLLIASPEYNSMFTPLLKNTIDWCTRDDDVDPFGGKVAAVVSASPGALGGIRSQRLVQQLLMHLGCHIVPGSAMLPQAHKAFDADGKLTDARALKNVQELAKKLVETTRKIAG